MPSQVGKVGKVGTIKVFDIIVREGADKADFPVIGPKTSLLTSPLQLRASYLPSHNSTINILLT